MICGLTLRSWSCDPLLLGLRDYSWGLFPLSAGLRPGTRQEILPESLGDWITKCYRLPQHLGEDVGIHDSLANGFILELVITGRGTGHFRVEGG